MPHLAGILDLRDEPGDVQICTAQDLRELEAAWRELQEAGGVSHPMYSWEWMATWWEVFGEQRSLLALIKRKGGKVEAIAPFVRHKARMNRFFLFRRLELMGTGEQEADEVFSECVDLPLRPEGRTQAARELADQILDSNHENKWDDVVLYRVRTDSAVCRAFGEGAANRGLSATRLASGRCPYVELPGSVEDYERQLSGNRRQQIRRGVRALEGMGKLSFEKAQTIEEALVSLKMLAELHGQRWQAAGKPGAFAGRRFSEFHRRFIERTFALGWPELWTLRVGQEPIACLYNIRYQRRVSFYQSGIKRLEDNRVRPGMLAHYFAIRDAIESGAVEYDFMLGESRYKVSLSNAARELVTLRIARRCAKERLRRAVVLVARPARGLVSSCRKRFHHESTVCV